MSHGGSVWEEQPAKRLRAIRRARWKAAYRRVTRILEAIVTALLLAGVVLVGGLLALAGLALTTLPPANEHRHRLAEPGSCGRPGLDGDVDHRYRHAARRAAPHPPALGRGGPARGRMPWHHAPGSPRVEHSCSIRRPALPPSRRGTTEPRSRPWRAASKSCVAQQVTASAAPTRRRSTAWMLSSIAWPCSYTGIARACPAPGIGHASDKGRRAHQSGRRPDRRNAQATDMRLFLPWSVRGSSPICWRSHERPDWHDRGAA